MGGGGVETILSAKMIFYSKYLFIISGHCQKLGIGKILNIRLMCDFYIHNNLHLTIRFSSYVE